VLAGPPKEQSLLQIPKLPQSEIEAAKGESSLKDAAQQEAATLASGLSRSQLEDNAAVADHHRSERFRNNFENLAIFALWVLSISVAAIGAIWLLHMVLPAKFRWLSTEDLSHIQSIVTAGLLVGVIGNHFKKRLG
jgi:hypothetical protein